MFDTVYVSYCSYCLVLIMLLVMKTNTGLMKIFTALSYEDKAVNIGKTSINGILKEVTLQKQLHSDKLKTHTHYHSTKYIHYHVTKYTHYHKDIISYNKESPRLLLGNFLRSLFFSGTILGSISGTEM